MFTLINNNIIPCTVCLQCILVISFSWSLPTVTIGWCVVLDVYSRLVQVWPLELDPRRKYWTLQEVCFVKIKHAASLRSTAPSTTSTCTDTNSNTPCCLMWLILHTKTTEIKIRTTVWNHCFKPSAGVPFIFYSVDLYQRHIWEWKKRLNKDFWKEIPLKNRSQIYYLWYLHEYALFSWGQLTQNGKSL